MSNILNSLYLWFDTERTSTANNGATVKWLRFLPFIVSHLICLSVIWVGISWSAVIVCLLSYVIRVFAITGFYHRCLSHRAYKTSRIFQLLLCLLASSAAQRGPLWWAAHHRHHHKYADQKEDLHSPKQKGFIWSHCGWFASDNNFKTNFSLVPDLVKFPELVFLNRFDMLMPVIYAVLTYFIGSYLQKLGFNTTGMQMLIWGYFISTILIYHATFLINSLAHVYGKRRFETKDESRNNLWLALLTLGEGWHNNHHYYPSSVRQGFYFYEIDITFYILKIFEKLGLIWDLRLPPKEILDAGRQS